MLIEVQYGTPGELKAKNYKQPGDAKKFLRTKIGETEKWGRRFAHRVELTCQSIREDVDGLDLRTIDEGTTRSWQVTDDITQVTFVWKVTKVSN